MAGLADMNQDMVETLETLHCLEQAICARIDRDSEELGEGPSTKVVVAWGILTKMLKETVAFKEMGIKPSLARGLMAEIMFRYIVEGWVQSKGMPYIYLNNLLIPRADKGTTQLDGVFITPSFATVVECKSYKGKLNIVDGKISTRVQEATPWKQNYGHIMSLKEVLGDSYNIYFHNIVYIFSEGVIAKYEPSPEEYLIVNKVSFSQLDYLERNQNFANRLSQGDLNDIAGILSKYKPSVEEEEEHIRFVNSLIRE